MENCKEFNVTVRPMEAGDTGLLYGHFCDLSERSRAKFRPHDFTIETAQKFTGEGLTDPECKRFIAIAEKDGEKSAAGYCFLGSWDKESPWLGIAVGDKWQGLGVGKSMMEYMINYCRENGKKELHLSTDKDNIAGQKLYAKCGFIITGEGDEEDYKLMLKL
ncbi:MAG: GNAT family N-acetyltransferase [Eubacteriales bacterium]